MAIAGDEFDAIYGFLEGLIGVSKFHVFHHKCPHVVAKPVRSQLLCLFKITPDSVHLGYHTQY